MGGWSVKVHTAIGCLLGKLRGSTQRSVKLDSDGLRIGRGGAFAKEAPKYSKPSQTQIYRKIESVVKSVSRKKQIRIRKGLQVSDRGGRGMGQPRKQRKRKQARKATKR